MNLDPKDFQVPYYAESLQVQTSKVRTLLIDEWTNNLWLKATRLYTGNTMGEQWCTVLYNVHSSLQGAS